MPYEKKKKKKEDKSTGYLQSEKLQLFIRNMFSFLFLQKHQIFFQSMLFQISLDVMLSHVYVSLPQDRGTVEKNP